MLVGRPGDDRERVDPFLDKVGERRVDGALAGEAGHAGESGRFDLDGEVALAAFAAIAAMAAMFLAVVAHDEPCRSEGGRQPLVDFGGDRAGDLIVHRAYIARLERSAERVLASAGERRMRFHGRIETGRACDHPGCEEAGEFRAPPAGGRRPGKDGPGEWRWLCLDHVRAFNSGYNYFSGMSEEEIAAAHNPYGGWDRETRAFAANGSPPPRWADFADPLDAIGARFQRAGDRERRDGRMLSDGDRRNLNVLGLPLDADRRALRTRYAELVRKFHPDRNGGDRSHEKALQAVIEAYQALKGRPAFA
jgi:hypothetical protein